MLSKDQIEILTDKYITKLYDDLEREVISDIARRVKKMERFTETAELQAMAMREQGYSPSKIQQQVFKRLNADKDYQRQLAENTKEYKQEIKKIIEETVEAAAKAGDNLVGTAGDMAWNDDMKVWKKHSVDLKKPNGLKQLYDAIAKQTNEEMKNITQSTGFKGTTLGTTGVLNAYRRAMDMATLKMATGAFSYQTAVTDCIKALADSGLRSIDYASGRSYQLDTAARMCIRTGMNQLAGKIMQMNLEQTSTPLVYVDAHAGSRPEHAVWQGQVYAYDPEGTLKDGSKAGDKYDDFFHATDYGSPTGLMGVNCAHHFYPYWEGDVIPEYTEPDPIVVDGKKYTYYEATQEMRRQERNIRKTKRNMEAMHTLGNDTTGLKKKARLQEKQYLDFCKTAKINPRKYVLTVPFGITAQPNQQQPEQKTGFTKLFNKNGKEIQFGFVKSDKEHINQGRDRQKEILSKLSMEYNTRLETVSGGAYKAAGDVDITGQAMRLNSTTLDAAIHEFAHTLANTDADKFGLTADNEFWNEVRKIRTEYRKALRNDPSKSISSYATGSKELDEFMAEAFTHAKAKQLGINLPYNYGNDYTYSDKVLAVVDKYFGKSLTNANKSSTIQTEMLRRTDRSRSREGYSFISDKRFDDITIPARKNGAIIMRGGEDVEKRLDNLDANASCLGEVMFFREKVTVSEALEETRHFEQNRIGLNDDKPYDLREALNEIDAKEYILQNAKKYSVPQVEIDETRKMLESYRQDLEKLKEKYDV